MAGWHFQLFESADYSSKVRRRHSIQLEVQSQFVEVSGTCDQNCFPAHGITTASLCNTSISKYYSARIGVVLDLLLVPISHFLSRVLLCSFSHGSYFLNYKRRKQFFLRPTKRETNSVYFVFLCIWLKAESSRARDERLDGNKKK